MKKRYKILTVALVLIALLALILETPLNNALNIIFSYPETIQLPYYVFRSTLRIFYTLLLCLAVGVPYGIICATSKKAGKIMLPIVDVLQSVPVLGYMPAAILLFLGLFPGPMGRALGLELASMLLIFTGMVWSIIFGTINGVETIPDDIKKAAEAHGITGTRYLKNVLIPAIYPSLITGCLLAVGGGWYFLIACEFITLGEQNYTLPGIGYYLQRAAYDANFVCAIFGLIVLICLIYALNKLIWYPLISYSSKYRYETVGTLDVEELEKNPLPRFLKRITKGILNGLITIEDFFHNLNIKPQTLRRIKTVVKWAFYCVGAVIVGWIASFMVFASTGFVNDLINTTTKHPEASQIFYFAVRSFTRLAAGYLIALAIALSVGITVAMSPRLTKIFTPVFDIGQSVPALALFPIIVVLFINFLNGSPIALEISSVILLLTGMQWYLLFNVMSAVRGIPNDIFEAGRAYGLSKFQLVRHIVFPAIFSRTVFGSMEAWGGGWNATIVSEYVLYGGQVYWVPGLGALLNFSAAVWDSVPMVVITIIMMAAIILLMNELLWQRLIKWGTRFNIEM